MHPILLQAFANLPESPKEGLVILDINFWGLALIWSSLVVGFIAGWTMAFRIRTAAQTCTEIQSIPEPRPAAAIEIKPRIITKKPNEPTQ